MFCAEGWGCCGFGATTWTPGARSCHHPLVNIARIWEVLLEVYMRGVCALETPGQQGKMGILMCMNELYCWKHSRALGCDHVAVHQEDQTSSKSQTNPPGTSCGCTTICRVACNNLLLTPSSSSLSKASVIQRSPPPVLCSHLSRQRVAKPLAWSIFVNVA